MFFPNCETKIQTRKTTGKVKVLNISILVFFDYQTLRQTTLDQIVVDIPEIILLQLSRHP